jgi:hypothetical protein
VPAVAQAAASNVDEVLEVRNVTKAMEYYARQAKDDQLRRDVKAIQLRATRKLGELIKEQKETIGLSTGGGDTSGGRLSRPPQDPPTLAEAGISKDLSSQAQKLAEVPEEEFEAGIQDLTNPAKSANDIEITDEDRDKAFAQFDDWRNPKKKAPLKGPDTDDKSFSGFIKWLNKHVDMVKKQQQFAQDTQQDEYYWKMHTLRFIQEKLRDFKRAFREI